MKKLNVKKIIGIIGAAAAAAGSVILAEKAGENTFPPTLEPLGGETEKKETVELSEINEAQEETEEDK